MDAADNANQSNSASKAEPNAEKAAKQKNKLSRKLRLPPATNAGDPIVRPYLPKRHRRSIKADRVQAADLARYDVRFFCDQCSHFDSTNARCTIGYVPQHTQREQMALYNLTGSLAFCRFMEID